MYCILPETGIDAQSGVNGSVIGVRVDETGMKTCYGSRFEMIVEKYKGGIIIMDDN